MGYITCLGSDIQLVMRLNARVHTCNHVYVTQIPILCVVGGGRKREKAGWVGVVSFLEKKLVKLTNKFPLRTLVEVTGCHHKYLQGQAVSYRRKAERCERKQSAMNSNLQVRQTTGRGEAPANQTVQTATKKENGLKGARASEFFQKKVQQDLFLKDYSCHSKFAGCLSTAFEAFNFRQDSSLG